MIRKEYKYGQDAREAIYRVAHSIGDTLGKTLGPAGRNYQTPEGITNDGRSILSHIRFLDECEDNVALAFHEVANKTDSDVGDGTTTATVIATEIVKELIMKVPDLDAPIPGQESVMDLSRKLEEEKDKAIALLKAEVVPVETLEQLEGVAFTSMEDKDIAKVVAATIFEAGKDSHTSLEEGFTGKIETNIQAGIELPLQVAAPFMYTRGREAVYEGTIPVMVANHLFEDYKEITNFLSSMLDFTKANQVNPPAIVIVGKQFSIPFVQAVSRVFNQTQGKINILLLSNSHFEDELFKDVAAFCDAKYVDTHPKGGGKITDVQFRDSGLVSKIVATPKGAVFYGGKGTQLNAVKETTRVQARLLEIREQLSKETDPKKRAIMERRMAEFQGGKATIYVDAATAAEKYYIKLKVQDCMNSCKAALEGGMIPGGGLTLSKVAAKLGEDSLLYKPLVAPFLRIQANAGQGLIVGPEVMDSYLVAEAGIRNAVSVVKTVLTIEGVIADHPQSMVEELKAVISE